MADKQHQSTEERQVEQAFLTGFENETLAAGRPVPPQPKEAGAPVETKQQVQPKPDVKPDDKSGKTQAKPAAKKPQVEFVRLTKTEYDSLKTNAGKVPELEKRIEAAFGKFGPTQHALNEIRSTVEKLTAGTPKGQAVELPADVVSELEAEYPDLAGGVKAALTKALKGLIGTGTGDADREKSEKARFDKYVIERAALDLDEIHPKWREIVGAVDDPNKADPKHPYRAWLAKQPEQYQAKINNSNNPTVISRSIDKCLASCRGREEAVSQKPAAQKPHSSLRPTQGSRLTAASPAGNRR
jgi:hypothetical protein